MIVFADFLLACNDHVEAEEHPGQVHRLELWAEPEVDDGVLVELAPHVQDGEDHRVHQHRDVHEQRHQHAEHPVEEQHEQVVGRSTVEYSGLKA